MTKKNLYYSDNVIFYDGEFTDLDPTAGELLSIGLVKNSGEELYMEFDWQGPTHPWVEKNVLPYLKGKKISAEQGREKIWKFIGYHREKEKPYLVAYVNQFDSIFWYKLFGSAKDHPVFWIPIDFASILFAFGLSPDSMGKKRFFDQLEIDKSEFKEHNALDDAKLLRLTYGKLKKNLQRQYKHNVS